MNWFCIRRATSNLYFHRDSVVDATEPGAQGAPPGWPAGMAGALRIQTIAGLETIYFAARAWDAVRVALGLAGAGARAFDGT